MDARAGYRETASAHGVWLAPLQTTVGVAAADLADSLIHMGIDEVQLSAAVFPGGDLILFRDPSATLGAPPGDACQRYVDELVDAEVFAPRVMPRIDVAVFLGLREGYALDASVHTVGEVAAWLPASDRSLFAVELVSARRIDGKLHPYREPGVLITATPDQLPAITELAGELKQHRFIVADRTTNRTYALAKENHDVR